MVGFFGCLMRWFVRLLEQVKDWCIFMYSTHFQLTSTLIKPKSAHYYNLEIVGSSHITNKK